VLIAHADAAMYRAKQLRSPCESFEAPAAPDAGAACLGVVVNAVDEGVHGLGRLARGHAQGAALEQALEDVGRLPGRRHAQAKPGYS